MPKTLLTHTRPIDERAVTATVVTEPHVDSDPLQLGMIPTGGRVEQDDVSGLRATNRRPSGAHRIARSQALSLQRRQPCSALLDGGSGLWQSGRISGHLDRVFIADFFRSCVSPSVLVASPSCTSKLSVKGSNQDLITGLDGLPVDAHPPKVGTVAAAQILDEDTARLHQHACMTTADADVRQDHVVVVR